MKVMFLTNNYEVTKSLLDWLIKKANVDVIPFSDKLSLEALERSGSSILISYNYRHIITEDVLRFVGNRAINLHVSFLPWNRGSHPNFWSFLDDTPKGVTIHLIDRGIDTGDILLQKEIYFNEKRETLKSSYEKLHMEIQSLFIENWERIKEFTIEPQKQDGKGSFHPSSDFEKIKVMLEDNFFDQPLNMLIQRYREKSDVYTG